MHEAREKWIAGWSKNSDVSAERIAVLFDRYGTRAEELVEAITSGDRPFVHAPDFSVREVQYIAVEEHVEHVIDFLQRRSLLAMMGHTTYPLIEELADVIGAVRGWSVARREAEVDHAVAVLENKHNVQLPILA